MPQDQLHSFQLDRKGESHRGIGNKYAYEIHREHDIYIMRIAKKERNRLNTSMNTVVVFVN